MMERLEYMYMYNKLKCKVRHLLLLNCLKCWQYIYKISDLIFKKYLFLRSFVDAIKLFEDPDFHMQRKKFFFWTNTVAYLPFDLLT